MCVCLCLCVVFVCASFHYSPPPFPSLTESLFLPAEQGPGPAADRGAPGSQHLIFTARASLPSRELLHRGTGCQPEVGGTGEEVSLGLSLPP